MIHSIFESLILRVRLEKIALPKTYDVESWNTGILEEWVQKDEIFFLIQQA